MRPCHVPHTEQGAQPLRTDSHSSEARRRGFLPRDAFLLCEPMVSCSGPPSGNCEIPSNYPTIPMLGRTRQEDPLHFAMP